MDTSWSTWECGGISTVICGYPAASIFHSRLGSGAWYRAHYAGRKGADEGRAVRLIEVAREHGAGTEHHCPFGK
jgi:hypothetical protein